MGRVAERKGRTGLGLLKVGETSRMGKKKALQCRAFS